MGRFTRKTDLGISSRSLHANAFLASPLWDRRRLSMQRPERFFAKQNRKGIPVAAIFVLRFMIGAGGGHSLRSIVGKSFGAGLCR